jgi:hypothetical protein
LKLPIEQTGMTSAVSPAIMFIIKLIAGQSSDKIKFIYFFFLIYKFINLKRFISDSAKLRIYNTLSLSAMGILFCVLAILDPIKNPSICLVFF